VTPAYVHNEDDEQNADHDIETAPEDWPPLADETESCCDDDFVLL
jgi:hypothetical protein